jgi:hypothetical protein
MGVTRKIAVIFLSRRDSPHAEQAANPGLFEFADAIK